MTTSQSPNPESSRSEPGYRGSLPSRDDRLAGPWILAILAIFVLVIVLAIAGIPSRFIADPTAPPPPTLPPASGSVQASPSGFAEASPSGSVEASPSGSAEASPEPSPSGE